MENEMENEVDNLYSEGKLPDYKPLNETKFPELLGKIQSKLESQKLTPVKTIASAFIPAPITKKQICCGIQKASTKNAFVLVFISHPGIGGGLEYHNICTIETKKEKAFETLEVVAKTLGIF